MDVLGAHVQQIVVCVCECVCVLELFHKVEPAAAAAAGWNHLHTIEQQARAPSNREGFGGFKL